MIIIEKQLPINYKAVRMSQHTLTYFMVHLANLPTRPMFYEISPKLKGRELGVSPLLNERGLKLWAIEKATELLTTRNDKWGLEIMNRKVNKRKEKKDDLSDTVCQIEAFFSWLEWPLTMDLSEIKEYNENKIKNEKNQKPKLKLNISSTTVKLNIKPSILSTDVKLDIKQNIKPNIKLTTLNITTPNQPIKLKLNIV